MIAEKMEGTLAALLPEIYLKVKCADLVCACLLTYYVFQEKRKMKSIDSRLSFPWL